MLKEYTTHMSRKPKLHCKDDDRASYCHLLSQLLHSIDILTDVLLCTSGSCCDSSHIEAINKYANDISRACSQDSVLLSRTLVTVHRANVYHCGLNMSVGPETSR